MTHASDPHGAPSEAVFTSEEWQELHKDDRTAAKTVCGLMLGIFGVGVVLYTIVVLAVV